MFQALLKKIADKFEQHQIPYMIIGGQAVLKYGEPRLTKDIDITLGFSIDKFEMIQKIILKNPNIDFNYIRNWLDQFSKTMQTDFGKKLEKLLKV